MGLASMRAAARAHLTEIAETMLVEACTVRHPGTATPDGAGGFTAGSATDVATTCQRLPALTDAEREIAGRLAIVRPVVLALPVDTVCDEADEVYVGAERFVIKAIAAGTWAVRMRVLCSQVA